MFTFQIQYNIDLPDSQKAALNRMFIGHRAHDIPVSFAKSTPFSVVADVDFSHQEKLDVFAKLVAEVVEILLNAYADEQNRELFGFVTSQNRRVGYWVFESTSDRVFKVSASTPDGVTSVLVCCLAQFYSED